MDPRASLPSAAAQLGRPEVRALTDSICEIVVLRDTPQGKQASSVYLIKGHDGVWRIEGM